jgi:hypothetical protein
MGQSSGRILFCDYDGHFLFADTLSRVGFAVDQIRPDALRQVGVGDHEVFLFSFGLPDSLPKVLKTCEKLKFAELKTPIALLARELMGPDFLNHLEIHHSSIASIFQSGMSDFSHPKIFHHR